MIVTVLAWVGGLAAGWLVVAALCALGVAKAVRIANEIDAAVSTYTVEQPRVGGAR